MLDLDTSATRWINGWAGRNPSIDLLMILASTIGIPILVLAVAVQWWFPRRDPYTRHVVLTAGLAFLIGLGLNQFILLYIQIQRVRPYDAGVTNLLIDRSADFSFPSDHATAALAIATAFYFGGLRGRSFVFLVAAIIVAASRVYVGTHYVGDVLGGAGTGIVAALLARALYWKDTRFDRFLTSIL
jgi:undecaprenyl-diphosphatase